MDIDGLVTRESAYDFDRTLERLEAALKSKGVAVFARIDHAAGAKSAGLPLRPTTLFVFGNPKAGTPLMQANQTAGIDLPLKMLVWEDGAGTARLSYNDPAWISGRHRLGAEAAPSVSAMAAVLAALARDVAGGANP